MSVRSDRLAGSAPTISRCGRVFWVIPQREGARYGPGERAHVTFCALKRPHVCGTGHSRLSLLCRVLAEGESAPSARKWGIAVNFEMDPPENAQTRSKRDPRRSCGCEGARCRPGRSCRLRGGASAGAAEAQSPRRRAQSCRPPVSAGAARRQGIRIMSKA